MLISMMEKGCKIGFFGLGLSSTALLECLPLRKCRVTLRSDKDINWSLIPCGARIERIFAGSSAYTDLDEDIIIFSPSVRRERKELLEAKKRGCIFTSDAELFFEKVNGEVFAVTGSDGKSTTATLVSRLLSAGGTGNLLVGNIGRPMFPSISNAPCFVTELSSFMLTYVKPRAKRGCITNITPNHLDWHKSFDEYKKTKISLAKSCEEIVICDNLSEIANAYGVVSLERSFEDLRKECMAEVYMTLEDGHILKNGKNLIEVNTIRRRERHNLQNAMMAIAMTEGYVSNEQISDTLRSFDGLSHRCERLMSVDGIDFYDSSIDSTPRRTAITLESLGRQVVLILGGRSKGLDFTELIPSLKKYSAMVIITGENADEIYGAIGDHTNSVIIRSFEEAVKEGINYASDIGVLLLSPASTSYDLFRNYAERGERFKNIIQEIYKL